jgi:hypothetical protein
LLQAAGFLSRVVTGSRAINQLIGLGIIALAIPAGLAFVAFMRARTDWRLWLVTVATTVLLLGSMVAAIYMDVG